jgi:hypothetical protein
MTDFLLTVFSVGDPNMKGTTRRVGQDPVSWKWTLVFWHHEGRSPTHGYAATREAAIAASRVAVGRSYVLG